MPDYGYGRSMAAHPESDEPVNFQRDLRSKFINLKQSNKSMVEYTEFFLVQAKV